MRLNKTFRYSLYLLIALTLVVASVHVFNLWMKAPPIDFSLKNPADAEERSRSIAKISDSLKVFEQDYRKSGSEGYAADPDRYVQIDLYRVVLAIEEFRSKNSGTPNTIGEIEASGMLRRNSLVETIPEAWILQSQNGQWRLYYREEKYLAAEGN